MCSGDELVGTVLHSCMDRTDLLSLLKDQAAPAVANFTVGFVKLSRSGGTPDARPAGSGTLVTVGSVFGILTAAHVLENLPDHGDVGVVRFTGKQAVSESFTLKMEHTNRLVISADEASAEGPDLGFLKLETPDIGVLQARQSFANLVKRSDIMSCSSEPQEYIDGIAGLVAEWTTVRWSHFLGQFGSGVKVYSGV